jgi:hypothetical protein
MQVNFGGYDTSIKTKSHSSVVVVEFAQPFDRAESGNDRVERFIEIRAGGNLLLGFE